MVKRIGHQSPSRVISDSTRVGSRASPRVGGYTVTPRHTPTPNKVSITSQRLPRGSRRSPSRASLSARLVRSRDRRPLLSSNRSLHHIHTSPIVLSRHPVRIGRPFIAGQPPHTQRRLRAARTHKTLAGNTTPIIYPLCPPRTPSPRTPSIPTRLRGSAAMPQPRAPRTQCQPGPAIPQGRPAHKTPLDASVGPQLICAHFELRCRRRRS